MMIRALMLLCSCLGHIRAVDDDLSPLIDEFSARLTAGDAVGAAALLPTSNQAWQAQILSYTQSLAAEARTGQMKMSPLECHIDSDTAVLLVQFNASAGQRLIPFYALNNHGWHLLPTPTVAYRTWYDLTEEQHQRMEGLSNWARVRMVDLERQRHGAAQAEAIAKWSFGEGSVADKAIKAGDVINLGQRINTSKKRPSRLVFVAMRDSNMVLAPGTSITFENQSLTDGSTQLIIHIHEGTIQAEINDLGPYTKVRARGQSSDVIVTGTVFVVQVARAKGTATAGANGNLPLGTSDYTATVSGKVVVVARNTDESEGIHLFSRQGLEVTQDGFGSVDQLLNRPQLMGSVYDNMDIRSQGLASAEQLTTYGGSAGEKSWSQPLTTDVASSNNNSNSNSGTGNASSGNADKNTSSGTTTTTTNNTTPSNSTVTEKSTSTTSALTESPHTSDTHLDVETSSASVGAPSNTTSQPITESLAPTEFSILSGPVATFSDLTAITSNPTLNAGGPTMDVTSPDNNIASDAFNSNTSANITDNIVNNVVENIQQEIIAAPARLGGAPGLPP